MAGDDHTRNGNPTAYMKNVPEQSHAFLLIYIFYLGGFFLFGTEGEGMMRNEFVWEGREGEG